MISTAIRGMLVRVLGTHLSDRGKTNWSWIHSLVEKGSRTFLNNVLFYAWRNSNQIWTGPVKLKLSKPQWNAKLVDFPSLKRFGAKSALTEECKLAIAERPRWTLETSSSVRRRKMGWMDWMLLWLDVDFHFSNLNGLLWFVVWDLRRHAL